MLRLLVTGGRSYRDRSRAHAKLDELKPDLVLVGSTTGADELAIQWAIKNRVNYHYFQAEWGKYGKKAAPIRNERMIVEGKPDLVLAFPGGLGTADCVRRAEEHGIRVERIGR